MKKLFAFLALVAMTATADEITFRTLQSGSVSGPTPLTDHGLHGEGQIIAILDTGVDWDNCFFAEPDGAPPPVNTGTPQGGYQSSNVDLSRRKIVAYDFLYSCEQFPNARGCDNPSSPLAYDNQGHGTVAAAIAAGDSYTPIVHDYADSIASAAKLVIQDTGFLPPSGTFAGGDNCSQRAGLGCPLIDLHPVLQQAYDQGARIHSNSWGDRQGVPQPRTPPTGNYPKAAQDIDDFVFRHPDMVVIFNTGNSGQAGTSSLSAPGDAKNTIQVGGTRTASSTNGSIIFFDDTLTWFSGSGPTRDGRLKPDLVGPAEVITASPDNDIRTNDCGIGWQPGTSWSSPSIAGAVAIVRQYYSEGFYPTGVPETAHKIAPSAALVKATLIASARALSFVAKNDNDRISAPAAPNYQEGFGFPVLGTVLHLPADRALLNVRDVPLASGLREGEQYVTSVAVRPGTPLRTALVWTDPPGSIPASDTTPVLVNDLDLLIKDPSGRVFHGNELLHPGESDHLNNVEAVTIDAPLSGKWTLSVTAHHLGQGPRQGYALVINGDLSEPEAPSRSRIARH